MTGQSSVAPTSRRSMMSLTVASTCHGQLEAMPPVLALLPNSPQRRTPHLGPRSTTPARLVFPTSRNYVMVSIVLLRGPPLEYWWGAWSFLEIRVNIFVRKMCEISKWRQDMVEINILPTQEVEINII